MSRQFAVPISFGITAIVYYEFPCPININRRNGDEVYILTHKGEKLEFKSYDKMSAHLASIIEEIAIKPKIHGIEFLQSKYKKQSISVYAKDLEKIQNELETIEPYKCETVEELIAMLDFEY